MQNCDPYLLWYWDKLFKYQLDKMEGSTMSEEERTEGEVQQPGGSEGQEPSAESQAEGRPEDGITSSGDEVTGTASEPDLRSENEQQ